MKAFLLIFGLITLLFTANACDRYECVEYAKISKLGACNRYGECGVLDTLGRKHTYVHQPVEGQNICSKREIVKN